MLVRVVEHETLLLGRVVARGHRHGLPVPALHQFDLALVHRLANGVIDEAFGKRLLQRRYHLGEGAGHGSRDLGMQHAFAAIFQAYLAMHDVGVCAGSFFFLLAGELDVD